MKCNLWRYPYGITPKVVVEAKLGYIVRLYFINNIAIPKVLYEVIKAQGKHGRSFIKSKE